MTTQAARHASIVLTGGRATRLGGADKTAVPLGGRSSARRVIEAIGGSPVVVVGSTAQSWPLRPDIVQVVESPAYGGPVAAIAEGLRHVEDAPIVCVAAGDMPFVTAELFEQLRAALSESHPVTLLRSDGHPQWLCAAWLTGHLRRRLAELGDLTGRSVRSLVGDEPTAFIDEDPSRPASLSFDVDTPEDLAQARSWTDER